MTLASGVALSSASGASSDSKQFEARFQESNVSVTNRIADLGIFQLINTGTGTVDGFGPATMMLGDVAGPLGHSVRPGQLDERGHPADRRRRRRADPSQQGVRLPDRMPVRSRRATWQVDGDSSTGVFAGARGSGTETVHIPTAQSSLSGKLKLVGSEK